MALVKLDFQPGINKENTPYSTEGGWEDSDKIRFRSGKPEKIGGWDKYISDAVVGIVRKLHVFRVLDGTIYLAVATTEKVYIESGGTLTDITPIRATISSTDSDNCLETTSGSTTVTVNITAHGITDQGAWVTFSGATTIGGIPDSEINAEHKVTYVDDDTFTFEVSTSATSTVASGGGTSIDVDCQINIGSASGAFAYGWGAGTWGLSTWGTRRPVGGIELEPTLWTFANWGEDLVLNRRGDSVWIWDASSPATRATQITQAPYKVNRVLVTQDRHMVCFGCNEAGTANSSTALDTLQVRWSSQEDYTDWTVTSVNTAGNQLLTGGTRITGVAAIEGQTIIWTDDDIHSMQFVGPPYTFSFQQIGTATGLLSPNAWAAYNNAVFWMGENSFYVYAGGVQAMPCTVHKYVFDGLSTTQRYKIHAALDRDNHEITWFYPAESVEDTQLNGAITTSDTTITVSTTAGFLTSGSIQIGSETIDYTGKTDASFTGCTRGARGTTVSAHADKADVAQADNTWSEEPYHYVTYNLTDKLWWVGNLERTAWVDKGALSYPVAAGTDGYLYSHEKGTDADGEPLVARIESSDFDLGEGDNMMFIHRVIPDFTVTGEVDLKFLTRYYPLSDQVNETVGTVTSTVRKIDTRIRGRQMSLVIESDQLGDDWKYGSTRIDQRADGKR